MRVIIVIDVYKRQGLSPQAAGAYRSRQVAQLPLRHLADIQPAEPDAVLAVSYTHLDVYKRQPLRSTLFRLSGDFGEVVKCKGNVHIL